MKWYSWVAGILAVCCMVMIYGFSAQESDESQSLSNQVTTVVMRVMTGQEADPADEAFQRADLVVRKLGHVSEYLLLAVLLLITLLAFPLPPWVRSVIVYAFCLTYALTDEWHQTSVLNRTGHFPDVAIDMIGVVASVVIYSIVASVRKRRRLSGKT